MKEKLINKKTFYSKKELIKFSLGQLFSKNSPKLPLSYMLMINRIIKIFEFKGKYKKGFIQAEFDIHPKLWFFKFHFIDDPVMPGYLGLDAMWQLIGFYLAWKGAIGKARALGAEKVEFKSQITPNIKKITYFINLKKIINKKILIGIADGKIMANKQLICKTINLKVGIL